ncbi:MAG: hypothetical protein AB7L41_04510, partial [Flavobacteriaceae bacterium]
MPHSLRRFLLARARAVMARRAPDFEIGPAGDPYMQRWWLLPRNRAFNVYLHRMLHDDDDRALHDHPWPSLSLMLDGRIIEHFSTDPADGGWLECRWLLAGDVVWRPARFAHRLVIPSPPAITVFITGPRLREWGFWCP